MHAPTGVTLTGVSADTLHYKQLQLNQRQHKHGEAQTTGQPREGRLSAGRPFSTAIFKVSPCGLSELTWLMEEGQRAGVGGRSAPCWGRTITDTRYLPLIPSPAGTQV